MSSSCIQRICDKNSITQFRRGGALVYKWVLLPMFVNVILGLAFGLCKWIWYWLLCSIRLALNNTKYQCKNLLRFFLVVFGGMVIIKHQILWGIPENRTPVPVSTLFSEMCGRFMWCPMSTFALGDTSGVLTSRTPLFWPPQAGRHLLPELLAPRALRYHKLIQAKHAHKWAQHILQ